MLAVELLGLFPALLVALAGGAYTLALWGHPYAMIIFAVEAVFVAYGRRRQWGNLLTCRFGILAASWDSISVVLLHLCHWYAY